MRVQNKYQLPIFLLFVFGLVLLRLITSAESFTDNLGHLIPSGLIIGAFLIRNKHKPYLISSAISLGLIPVSSFLFEMIISDTFLNAKLTTLVAIIALCFYILRFVSKPNKWFFWEIVKLLAVAQFVLLYAVNFIKYSGLSIAILAFIFLTTRLIQLENISKMFRNLISAMLVLITIFFMVYANLKANEADKQTWQAVENYKQIQALKIAVNRLENKLDSTQVQLQDCQLNQK